MRTKGYKCYNIKCSACVCKTLCGLSGDEALTCDSRMIHRETNADRIRAMSDEELAEMLYEADARPFSVDLERWRDWLQQPAKEDA